MCVDKVLSRSAINICASFNTLLDIQERSVNHCDFTRVLTSLSLIVLLMSCDCCSAFLHCTVGWFAECDCGIS